MGKTTTVSTIMGLCRRAAARSSSRAARSPGSPPYRIAPARHRPRARGPAGLPDALRASENLVATAAARSGPPRWTLERVYELFPRLQERRRNLGSQLSGGEQQMLAIGRALMTNPKLLILDEATEGLAPLIRAEIWACLQRLKSEGQAILVIDKNVDALTRFADRHVIIEKGRVVWTGTQRRAAPRPGRQRPLSARLSSHGEDP